jgi:FeS assembly SUF system protein
VEISGPEDLTGPIVESIKTVYDPEIPVNIYELGLIYEVRVDEGGKARVVFTLTSPHCPAAQAIPAEIETKVRAIEGVTEARLDLVWDPPWGPQRMSEVAQLTLGIS